MCCCFVLLPAKDISNQNHIVTANKTMSSFEGKEGEESKAQVFDWMPSGCEALAGELSLRM